MNRAQQLHMGGVQEGDRVTERGQGHGVGRGPRAEARLGAMGSRGCGVQASCGVGMGSRKRCLER